MPFTSSQIWKAFQRKSSGLLKRTQIVNAGANLVPSDFFLALLLLLNSLLVATTFILQQYFGLDVLTSLTFVGSDGWCAIPAESLGSHCFGDYALMRNVELVDNPWDWDTEKPWNYLAAGMVPSYIFNLIGLFFGNYSLGLLLFLVSSLIAVLVPSLWASKSKRISQQFLVIGILGVTSVPGLFVLDRGNTLAFAVPGILAFLIGTIRGNTRLSALSIVFLSLVKPQFALLSLIFLISKSWWTWAKVCLGMLTVNLLAFAFWPAKFPGTIVQAASNILQYGSSVSLRDKFPSNATLLKFPYFMETYVRQLNGDFGETWIDAHQAATAALILLFFIGSFFILNSRIDSGHIAIGLLALASMVAPTSWSYYLVFALPVAAIILRNPFGNVTHDWQGTYDDQTSLKMTTASRPVTFGLVIASALSVSRLVLPLKNEGTNLLWGSAELASSAWFLWLILLVGVGYFRLIRSRITHR